MIFRLGRLAFRPDTLGFGENMLAGLAGPMRTVPKPERISARRLGGPFRRAAFNSYFPIEYGETVPL